MSKFKTLMTEPDWKHIAAYLASCHAVTLERLPKGAAKHERKRLEKICLKAAAWMSGRDWVPVSNIKHVIERCEKAAKNDTNEYE